MTLTPPPAARLYLGAGTEGLAWAPPERSVLVLGPPRSGKTSALVIPTVLAAPGAVISTSTKPDVLAATASARGRRGNCLLFDPSAAAEAPPGVHLVRWSPVPACRGWDEARMVAEALVGASGYGAKVASGSDHWHERAAALLSTLLHAAALSGEPLPTVLRWVDRRQAAPALETLEHADAAIAADLLAGIAATEDKERSGIWSTTSGALAGYRGEAALAATVEPDFDAAAFCRSGDTLYVSAPGRHQAAVAPMVVGLLAEVRAAAYAAHAQAVRSEGQRPTPVVLALDEVANIAPVPQLPSMVSEGGGQGLLIMACLQDLSQARGRWGPDADGFLSLFGTTVVLPGIGDVRSLQALSALGGDREVVTRSVSAPLAPARVGVGRRLLGAMGRGRYGQVVVPVSPPTVTTATRRQPRLPVDAVARGRPGMALTVDERKRLEWVRLTPWFAHEPWRSMVEGPGRDLRGPERPAGRDPDPGRLPGRAGDR